MKLTIPQSILIGSVVVALAIIFQPDLPLASEAKAEVDGMDRFDLEQDRDFRKAVESIIEDCVVSGYAGMIIWTLRYPVEVIPAAHFADKNR